MNRTVNCRALAGAVLSMIVTAGLGLCTPALASVMEYEATNAVSTHGLWMKPLGYALGAADDYTFSIQQPGRFVYDNTAGIATLDVTGVSSGAHAVEITAQLLLRERGGPGTSGPQFGHSGVADASDWVFFDLLGGALHVSNGLLDGQSITIDTYPNPNDTKPPQLGVGANWLDGDFGFSMWFECEGYSGHCGDINLDLQATSVPEPSSIALLAGAIALVGLRRRKSTGRRGAS